MCMPSIIRSSFSGRRMRRSRQIEVIEDCTPATSTTMSTTEKLQDKNMSNA